jgi:hypothetical protein
MGELSLLLMRNPFMIKKEKQCWEWQICFKYEIGLRDARSDSCAWQENQNLLEWYQESLQMLLCLPQRTLPDEEKELGSLRPRFYQRE